MCIRDRGRGGHAPCGGRRQAGRAWTKKNRGRWARWDLSCKKFWEPFLQIMVAGGFSSGLMVVLPKTLRVSSDFKVVMVAISAWKMFHNGGIKPAECGKNATVRISLSRSKLTLARFVKRWRNYFGSSRPPGTDHRLSLIHI